VPVKFRGLTFGTESRHEQFASAVLFRNHTGRPELLVYVHVVENKADINWELG
jgi:hypothetical protein